MNCFLSLLANNLFAFGVALITAFVLLFMSCFLPYILDKILKKL